jgi:hypothetical protein
MEKFHAFYEIELRLKSESLIPEEDLDLTDLKKATKLT